MKQSCLVLMKVGSCALVKFRYFEKTTKFEKSPTFVWNYLETSKPSGRLFKFVWPSQHIWTLSECDFKKYVTPYCGVWRSSRRWKVCAFVHCMSYGESLNVSEGGWMINFIKFSLINW